MLRLVGPFITGSLALASTSAIAKAGVMRPSSIASELCPTLEQAAAENGLPFDFLFPSDGKKVASTPWQSAPKALKALRNSATWDGGHFGVLV